PPSPPPRAAILPPLARAFSLAVPRYHLLGLVPTAAFPDPVTNPLNTIPWLALVSVPLLVSFAAVAYVQRLRPRDLGLALQPCPAHVQQPTFALPGITLGRGEVFILPPAAVI